MRTTLSIDDDVLAVARTLAAERQVSLGEAITILARRGLERAVTVADGIPAFEVAPDAPALTPELVREANEE